MAGGYNRRGFATSLILSVSAVALVAYLVLSSQIVMALVPILGAGGVYANAGTLEADTGTIYPEYAPDNPTYSQPIGTTTPECSGGIPMYVIELDGQARATDFSFRKDVKIPFTSQRWISVQVDNVAIAGSNLKIFTSQFGGRELLIRNVRLREGKSTNKWGPQSGEFFLQGGQNTRAAVPGVVGRDISAWVHGATGSSITLEPQGTSRININITYPTNTDLKEFYIQSGLFGYNLTDDNYDYDNTGTGDKRVQRATADGSSAYFTCTDEDIPVFG